MKTDKEIPDGLDPTIITDWSLRLCFEQMRIDQKSDKITLKLSQQETICDLVERFYPKPKM